MLKKIIIPILMISNYLANSTNLISKSNDRDMIIQTQNKISESNIIPTNKSKIITINKIVASVNKGVITSNQVNNRVTQVLDTLKSDINTKDMQNIRKKVLEQMILQKIQLDLAHKSGIQANEDEINDTISNIIKTNKTSLPDFKQKLIKENISFDEFKQQIAEQIIMDKLKQRYVDSRVMVSDEEVNQLMSSEAYKNKIDYDLSYIMIGIQEQNNQQMIEDKKQLANKAYKDLQSGISFEQVSAKYSNAPNALNGGYIGWKNSATMPPQITVELSKLKNGQFTKIIYLPMGFFIFKINNQKGRSINQQVKQYHVRHILIKVNELTGETEGYNKIMIIKNYLNKDGADKSKIDKDFPKLAKEYSDDSSKLKGGDLGWIGIGDTVPQFESAVLNTPIGIISNPIRSPFGWHIIQVLETKQSNLSETKEKQTVQQEIRTNKAQLLYVQWLHDIREAASVKINDE